MCAKVPTGPEIWPTATASIESTVQWDIGAVTIVTAAGLGKALNSGPFDKSNREDCSIIATARVGERHTDQAGWATQAQPRRSRTDALAIACWTFLGIEHLNLALDRRDNATLPLKSVRLHSALDIIVD